MVEFRKYLEREGVDPGGYEEIPFPIHREEDLIGEGLWVPAVPDGRDFAAEQSIVLDEKENIKVNLDLSIRTEAMRMGSGGVATVTAKAGEGRPIREPYLSMLDWTAVHLDLLDYKEAKGFHNLLIPPDAPRRIMEKEDPAAYNLVADDAVCSSRAASPGSRRSRRPCRPSCGSTWTGSTACAGSAGTPTTWCSGS